MVDKVKKELEEALSAAIDGELEAQNYSRVADELVTNANARRTWQCYNLVHDALRKNLPDEVAPDLYERISSAVAQEPAHHLKVSPRREKKPWSIFGFQPAYGFVAAAALVVAVVTVTQIEREVSELPELAQVSPPSSLSSTSQPEVAGLSVVGGGEPPSAVNNPQLSTYLVNHSTRSRSYPMHDGLLPYVNSTGYQDGR